MIKHDTHQMHPNSLASWERAEPQTRSQQVLDVLATNQYAMTDREIATALGSQDMNYVRPVITRLVQGEKLFEVGTVVCETTNRKVRTVFYEKVRPS